MGDCGQHNDVGLKVKDGCHLIEVLYCQDCEEDSKNINFDCLKIGMAEKGATFSNTSKCGHITSLSREITDVSQYLSVSAPNFGFCPIALRTFVSKREVDQS